MWQDYRASYRAALRDDAFVAWRDIGAQQKARNILRVSRGIPVESVLEIGCGTGAVLRALQSLRFARKYAASDLSFEAIRFARKSCSEFLNGALVGQAASLPFESQSFSVAVLSHVIEHLEDPLAAVREASRVAEFVVIEVPTEQVFSNQFRTQILGKPYASSAGAGHLQFWSPGSIEDFLKNICGMHILARHRDLLSRRSEFYGKTGLQLAKPVMKDVLKTILPGILYSRLLTTHATFLCRRRDTGHNSGFDTAAAAQREAS
jgi:SAM-dependent methyltransferase